MNIDPRYVLACPKCSAPIGKWCTGRTGLVTGPHATRLPGGVAELSLGLPPCTRCGALEGIACMSGGLPAKPHASRTKDTELTLTLPDSVLRGAPLGYIQRKVLAVAHEETLAKRHTSAVSIAAQFPPDTHRTLVGTAVRSLVDKGYLVLVGMEGNRKIYVTTLGKL